jgi:hypothetical protein
MSPMSTAESGISGLEKIGNEKCPSDQMSSTTISCPITSNHQKADSLDEPE